MAGDQFLSDLQAVPEPQSWLLLALGGSSLALMGWWKRRAG